MKDYYWIVSVLFKTGDKVIGMKTAVLAGGLWEAVRMAIDVAGDYRSRLSADAFWITEIGIADDELEPPEGWWSDPLAEPEDWPE